MRELSARHERPFPGLSREALDLLVAYQWPGNVRELRNLIESMVVLAPGREITAEDIPRQIRDGSGGRFLRAHRYRGARRKRGHGRALGSSCASWWSSSFRSKTFTAAGGGTSSTTDRR